MWRNVNRITALSARAGQKQLCISCRGNRFLIAGALIIQAFAAGNLWALDPAKTVSTGPDLVTILMRPPTRNAQTGILEGAELKGEVVSETVAAANGWRSMSVFLDISCLSRRDRVRSMVVYAEHDRKGAAKNLEPPSEWIVPNFVTYGGAVVRYFCGDRGLAKRSQLIASLADLKTAPLAKDAFSPDYVSPSAPGLSKPPTRPLDLAETPSQALSAAVTSAPAWRKSPGHIDNNAVAADQPMRRGSLGDTAVQVGSSTVEADAKAILTHLQVDQSRRSNTLRTTIETVVVRGRRRFRAIVIGFANLQEAANFCSTWHSPDGCIVRPAP